ncbi:MAG: ribosome silencing factor [Firmicutes bacterium]|nr:ribosome silencing factor [Bacillota bacterium]
MKPEQVAALVAKSALDKKAEDVVILDMQELPPMTDYFVICTANNNLHQRAVRDEIIARTKEAGIKLRHREDGEGSRWVLLDYGDVVVHIFQQAEREFYALERLWGDAPKLAVSP